MANVIGGTKIPGLTYTMVGKTSSFYIDQDFLDTYVEVMGIDTSWVPGEDAIAKDAAITRSQIYIESLYYYGEKWWIDQYLQWPRQNVFDESGRVIDTDKTPYDIFNAVAEGAFQEYKTPGILQPKESRSDSYPLKRSKVIAGPVESEKEWETTRQKAVSSANTLVRLQSYLDHWVQRVGISVPLART